MSLGAVSGPPAVGALGADDRLAAVVERYAVAWSGIERSRAEQLPVLEGQTRALQEAGAALEALRPGAVKDLRFALRYDSQSREAMTGLSGPTRGRALIAGMAREAATRANPEVRAQCYVADWKRLEATHERRDESGRADGRARGDGGADAEAGRGDGAGPGARAALTASPARFGITPDSLLSRLLRGETPERVATRSFSQMIRTELDTGRGHGRGRDRGMSL